MNLEFWGKNLNYCWNSTGPLDTPRDRNSSFEPKIIKKGQTVLTEILVSIWRRLYGIEISKSSITAITDKILPKIKEWQNRPLDEIYPIIFLDAMHFKCTESNVVISKAFYTVLGINQEGKKDVLGLYLSESEGANFLPGVLTDLQNRGIKDILIACIDGLKGFPEAINSIFSRTEIQLCVIHHNLLKQIATDSFKII